MKIVILNQKGGVGKTTVTVNLAFGLANVGKKTLIIDIDPQAHSSVIYVSEVLKEETVGRLFQNKNFDIEQIIQKTSVIIDENGEDKKGIVKNLFIIPSNIHLASIAESITFKTYREKILHNHLKKINKEYDYILIDCPPTLNVLTINAIFTADFICIPTNYSKYSLDGISDLFESITEIKESKNYGYKILRNIKDVRSSRTNEVIENQLINFKDNLFKTIIRRTESINQSQMLNLPVSIFDPKSTGADDFFNLTKEVLKHG